MDDQAFPKPPKREKKKRKGLRPVRASGKQHYTTDQRARRKAEDTEYRRFTRPRYLLDLARSQGRLVRSEEALLGSSPQHKLATLRHDELPLCELALPETGCHGERVAIHVHHRKGRGPYLNDPTTYVGACPGCHDYVEANRKWAREMGFIESRHEHVQEGNGHAESQG
jgi:hypothetical protein